MKSETKKLLIVFAVTFAAFCAVTFAVPNEMLGVARFDDVMFWVSFAVTAVLLVADLIIAAKLTNDYAEKTLLGLTKLATANTVLIVSGVVGAVVLALPVIPALVSAGVSFVLTAYLLVAVKHVKPEEKSDAPDIKFITLLTADAETLVDRAVTDEGRALAKKVYEEIRYSDPVSSPMLKDDEALIQAKYDQFKLALSDENADLAKIAKDLQLLIKERNSKCKVLK